MKQQEHIPDDAEPHSGLHFLLVDDHEMLAFTMAGTLRSSYPGSETTMVTTVNKALDLLRSGKTRPMTIVLLDLVLEDGTGMDFLTKVQSETFGGRVATLVLSGKTSQQDIDACRSAGAQGYVTKRASFESVKHAIDEILSGRESFADGEAVPVPEMPAQFTRLSPGVRRVFPLLRQGLKNKEIGVQLKLTEATVKQHVNKIYKALEVTTKGELIARYGRGD